MSLCEPLRRKIQKCEEYLDSLGFYAFEMQGIKEFAITGVRPHNVKQEVIEDNMNLVELWQDLHECEVKALEEAKIEANKH